MYKYERSHIVAEKINTFSQRRLKQLRTAPKRLAKLPARLNDDIRDIERDRRYTPEYKAKEIAEIREAAHAELTKILSQAVDAEAQIRKQIKEVFDAAPGSDAALIVAIEKGRGWQRAMLLLDNGADPLAVVRRMADAGDLNALRVIAEELPHYLEAYGRGGETEAVMQELRQLETPLLTAEQQEARALEDEMEIGVPQIRAAGQWIGEAINGDTTIEVIPGWNRGETVDVPKEVE